MYPGVVGVSTEATTLCWKSRWVGAEYVDARELRQGRQHGQQSRLVAWESSDTHGNLKSNPGVRVRPHLFTYLGSTLSTERSSSIEHIDESVLPDRTRSPY